LSTTAAAAAFAATLLVLDRSVDSVVTLIHDFTYQVR
jgi:hypothetical protein